jgi:hypothetical protein
VSAGPPPPPAVETHNDDDQQAQHAPPPRTPVEDDELARLRAEARAQRAAMTRSLPSRHSRFGAVYGMRPETGIKSIRSNLTKPQQSIGNDQLVQSSGGRKKTKDPSALPRAMLQLSRSASTTVGFEARALRATNTPPSHTRRRKRCR